MHEFAALARNCSRIRALQKNADARSWRWPLARQIQEVSEELIHHSPWRTRQPADVDAVVDVAAAARLANECAPLARIGQHGSGAMARVDATGRRVGPRTRAARIAEIENVAEQVGEFARMEYDFLYDRRDTCWRSATTFRTGDSTRVLRLLASEPGWQLVGIAQGLLPQEAGSR